MTDADLAFASIEEVAGFFRKRELSPVELTKLMLARIEQLNPKLNAYITVTAELAMAQAKKAESELFAPRGRKGHHDRGPLHGIPISLKDNIYTAGIRTTAGSKILENFVPEHDAAVAAQLKAVGTVLLGKTNLHEFAYGVTNNNPHFGPVRNPWDPSRIPGGSSGGSAAAVAAGLCYASIGTDTGGSIRIPASLCGVVGLKPHYGRVSTSGVVRLSTSLDHVGPIARTAADAALVLRAITSGDYLAGSALKVPHPFSLRSINENRTKPHAPLHLAIPVDYFRDRIDIEVRAILMKVLRAANSKQAVLHECNLPRLHECTEPSTRISLAEATDFHTRSGWFPARAFEYGEDVRTRLEMGREILAIDYLAALATRQHAAILMSPRSDPRAFPRALVVPTTPFPAPKLGEEEVNVGGEKEEVRAGLIRLNRPANYSGLPSISVPCGFTASGLPVGLQIIGQEWGEKDILRIAHAFEKTHGFQRRRPPL
ncbi:MAG TPA: amidase [Candidatus Methylomirabilis sp.]|nr:amidase [Candidatus Methylomirabilis sp.]